MSVDQQKLQTKEVLEQLKATPSLRLVFFRHGETTKTDIDSERQLIPAAKKHALKVGNSLGVNLSTVSITQSGLPRATDTSVRMLGEENFNTTTSPDKEIFAQLDKLYSAETNKATVQELHALIREKLQKGLSEQDVIQRETSEEGKLMPATNLIPSLRTDQTLLFNYDARAEYNNEFLAHYKKNSPESPEPDICLWLLNESDQFTKNLAIDLAKLANGEKEKGEFKNEVLSLTPYSRMAGNLAKIVSGYFSRYGKLKKLYQENQNEEQIQIDRLFGTHSIMIEAFLMKIVEKTQGKEATLALINNGKENGFIGPNEFFEAEITDKDGQAELNIKFKGQTIKVTQSILNEIIQEAEETDNAIRAAFN